MKNTIASTWYSRIASGLLLITLFWGIAAASLSGFVGKWGFREAGTQDGGIFAIFDQTAARPFIYRQLVPRLAEAAERMLPERTKQLLIRNIHPEKTFTKASGAISKAFRFRYLMVYCITFISLFISLIFLFVILRKLQFHSLEATFSPVCFIIALPYIQTVGGYYYDASELAFMSLAFLLSLKGQHISLIATAVAATINKETFIFFLPSLYPILSQSSSRKRSIFTLIACIAISGIINIVMKSIYANNPGDIAAWNFKKNLVDYFRTDIYTSIESTYGVPGPNRLFIGTLIVVAILISKGWKQCPRSIRQHALIALAISAPLFFLFCGAGELRNLSFLYVAFVIIIANTLSKYATTNTLDS